MLQVTPCPSSVRFLKKEQIANSNQWISADQRIRAAMSPVCAKMLPSPKIKSKLLVTEGQYVPSLETGACVMNLNQLLYKEQVAMMRHDAATETDEKRLQRSELANIGQALEPHHYPHRPYLGVKAAGVHTAAKRKTLSIALSRRLNDDGAR
jgi:hypothetical protein